MKKVALIPWSCKDLANPQEYLSGPSSKVNAKTPGLLQWLYVETVSEDSDVVSVAVAAEEVDVATGAAITKEAA